MQRGFELRRRGAGQSTITILTLFAELAANLLPLNPAIDEIQMPSKARFIVAATAPYFARPILGSGYAPREWGYPARGVNEPPDPGLPGLPSQ